MFDLLLVVPLISVVALGFSLFLTARILKESEGTDRMVEIAEAVRAGAAAFLNRQYQTVAWFFGIVFAILLYLSIKGYLVIFVPFAFLTGGLFSGLSGFCGMKIATQGSARTANACQSSLNAGLRLGHHSYAVVLVVVRIILTQLEHRGVELLPALRDGNAWRQPRHNVHPVAATGLEQVVTRYELSLHHARGEQGRVHHRHRALESLFGHSHHLPGLAVQGDGPPNH